jgi:hypothetical protein
MKYKINDIVWVLSSSLIKQGMIVKRSLFEEADGLEILSREDYTVDFGYDRKETFYKTEVFPTLEELVNAKTIPYES